MPSFRFLSPFRSLLVLGACLLLALVASPILAQTTGTLPPDCEVADNGTGTVTLPPAGCEYLSPSQVHMIIDGLPPGTTIIVEPIHGEFYCGGSTGCEVPGGPLGGNIETFSSNLQFSLSGTGALAGWTHTVSVPAQVRTYTAARTPGTPVQSFASDMGHVETPVHTDSVFAHFKVVGGTDNGYPSPGHTELTDLGNGMFRVESWFDVGYRIEFHGTQTGPLAGYGGTTQGTVRMEAFD